ncbi:MAG: VOC family protein [Acidobacteria bacterium]|nr:VOC family protein [Acidobacteriota bacterium]
MVPCWTRRSFLLAAGGLVAQRGMLWAGDTGLLPVDHLILGAKDLDSGIAFVEHRAGVRAAFGGQHPGRGTHNALLSLGEHRYLEIIAPDPKQCTPPQFPGLREIEQPRLLGWAARCADAAALAKRLSESSFAVTGPVAGSRQRPDGGRLSWMVLFVQERRDPLLPFFIEWGRDSVHPSEDSPAGCRLERFVAQSPDPASLTRTIHALGVDLPVERGEKARLLARIAGPRAGFDLMS